MSYAVKSLASFRKGLHRLAKKYPSILDDVDALIDSLQTAPTQGVPLGRSCYKVRLAIASKGRGKSGGARVITTVFVTQETVYLLAIYDKSDQDGFSDRELSQLLTQLGL